MAVIADHASSPRRAAIDVVVRVPGLGDQPLDRKLQTLVESLHKGSLQHAIEVTGGGLLPCRSGSAMSPTPSSTSLLGVLHAPEQPGLLWPSQSARARRSEVTQRGGLDLVTPTSASFGLEKVSS